MTNTLGSLGSCVTILGPEVFSTVSSQFEYEESEKNYAEVGTVSKTRKYSQFWRKIVKFWES